jgi:simple sugar transport system ATP-binding protein
VTDEVYVMRAGSVVALRATTETSEQELADLMVGRKIRLTLDKTPVQRGAPLLTVSHLSLHDERGVLRLDDVSFSIAGGEILGIAGVSGNGQSELLEVLAGIRRPEKGGFVIGGREITAERPCGPSEMRGLGLAHVPEDRHRLGLVGNFSASESALLGYQHDPAYGAGWLLDRGAVQRHCAALMEEFDVRPRAPALRSANFSGGNQQKLIIAREMARRPKLLLVGQLTRASISAPSIHPSPAPGASRGGCGILLVSVELEEVMALADRSWCAAAASWRARCRGGR